ncbi:MAG: hypothetical protein FJX62_20375 [Alphaproteobacteria bacterium]|nr:hypothetical protein [Alphaproteobacteria bacterium]
MAKPQAYQALEVLGLRHPPIYEMEELNELRPDLEIYVRGAKSNPLLNQRYYVRDILEWKNLSELVRRGDLIAVERSPVITFGGATATNEKRQTYIEVAVGHTSGLLHYGYCAARFLYAADHSELIEARYETQIDVIRQGIGKLAESPVRATDRSTILQVGKQVWQQLSRDRHQFDAVGFAVTEWIYSDDHGVEFVDLKCTASSNWSRDFRRVFQPRPIVLEDTISDRSRLNRCMVGLYCASYRETEGLNNFHARIRSEALLSHFFSYTSEKHRIIELI